MELEDKTLSAQGLQSPTFVAAWVGDGQSDIEASGSLKPAKDDFMHVKIAQLGGEKHTIETHPLASISDVKSAVHELLGHAPVAQNLIFGTIPLTDPYAELSDVGIADGSVLTLVLRRVAMGQSYLQEASGKKMRIHQVRRTPEEALSEFEFKSWQAAVAADEANVGIWSTADEPLDKKIMGKYRMGWCGLLLDNCCRWMPLRILVHYAR
jgi:hypothetical protein